MTIPGEDDLEVKKLTINQSYEYDDLSSFLSGKLETMNDAVFFEICACQNEETYV